MKKESHKALWISLAALVISGAVLGLVMVAPWNNKKTEKFFGNQIDKFCVNDNCLQKSDGNWLVTNGKMSAPANNEIVNDYVSRFSSIELGDVISTNPDNFADLGIGVSQVILTANGRSLEIGEINSNYNGTDVREKDGKTVFNIDIVLEKDNLGNTEGWINKTITNLAVLQTNKITVSKNGNSVDFVTNNGVWDDPKWMEKADGLTATGYLNGFVPGNETKTIMTIETDHDKTTLTLGKNNSVFWATTDGKYYYSISGDDYLLLTGKIK